jgi:hypothetical protein
MVVRPRLKALGSVAVKAAQDEDLYRRQRGASKAIEQG